MRPYSKNGLKIILFHILTPVPQDLNPQTQKACSMLQIMLQFDSFWPFSLGRFQRLD